VESEKVIEVKDVHKKFRKYFDKSNSLKEKVLYKDRNKYQEYWVLKGISFDIYKGESVGIIGCNGCGKSTTLKLLTKIIYPDNGRIEIKGRVSSLLELGAGFHPDLSGFENIYLNASIFGLTKKEIDRRIDKIIRFSELKEFINNPIRTYSSGMYMKLAFSVAINVDADILLIDEILGVGDINFQQKCFEKLMEIKDNGTTIVIVSHSMDQIERICDKSIWIEDGLVKKEGCPKEVHKEYAQNMENKRIIRKQEEKWEEEKKREEERKREEEKKRRINKKSIILMLQKKEQEETLRQEELIKAAEIERQRQKTIQTDIKLDEVPEDKIGVVFFKKEANRLEAVVSEKNAEINRLNSVIRQKDILIEKNNINLSDEIERLNAIIIEKDKEISRLMSILQN